MAHLTDEMDRKTEEVERAKANLAYWEQRVRFQLAERQRLAAEVEAQEQIQELANAELERAKAAVVEQIRVLGIRPN